MFMPRESSARCRDGVYAEIVDEWWMWGCAVIMGTTRAQCIVSGWLSVSAGCRCNAGSVPGS